MKKKSNYRTPKRLLSLFLSVLLLLSSFVFASPTVSKAATTITHTPSIETGTAPTSHFIPHCGGFSYNECYFQEQGASTETLIAYDAFAGVGNNMAVYNNGRWKYCIYSIYDFNPNATNYTSYYWRTFYSRRSVESDYVYNNDTISSDPYIVRFSDSNFVPLLPVVYASDSVSKTVNELVEKVDLRLSGSGENIVSVYWKVYGINTTSLVETYDKARAIYETEDSSKYTSASWKNFVRKFGAVRNLVIDHGYRFNFNNYYSTTEDPTIIDPQSHIHQLQKDLENAISLLTRAEATLSNVFNQVDGAILTGPEKVYIGDEFEATVKLQEGYTQSVPTLTVTTGDTTETVTGTKASDGSYKFKVTLRSEDNNSITPAGVNKNTYTVTVPSSGTGFTASKSGTVTHGENYTFTVKLLDGYTQTLPTVKAGTVTLGATPIGNNTYSYTITGVKADTSVSINGVAANTYSVGYTLGAGVSKGSGTATTIQHGSNATVKITVGDAYTQVTSLPISVTNGTLSTGTRSGNTFTYTLSGVTADTTVKVTDLTKNQYTVTVPDSATGLDISNTGSHTKTYGDDFSFTVTKQTGYTQATPVVKVNDVEIAGVQSDNTYTYKITNITENKNVKVILRKAN